jgi:hypothetical protein
MTARFVCFEVLLMIDNIFLPDRKTASVEHGKQKQDLKR